jgi:hypothetical protein
MFKNTIWTKIFIYIWVYISNSWKSGNECANCIYIGFSCKILKKKWITSLLLYWCIVQNEISYCWQFHKTLNMLKTIYLPTLKGWTCGYVYLNKTDTKMQHPHEAIKSLQRNTLSSIILFSIFLTLSKNLDLDKERCFLNDHCSRKIKLLQWRDHFYPLPQISSRKVFSFIRKSKEGWK